jgi:hypothetical protein
MKKIGISILFGIMVCSVFFSSVKADDAKIITDQQLITISNAQNGLSVEETITVTNTGRLNATVFSFWIQQDATDMKIIAAQSGTQLSAPYTGNTRTCNLTNANLTIIPGASLDFTLTYTLPSATENFEKTLLYDTTLFTITYNEQELFQGEHLQYADEVNNALQIRLYNPTEAPLNITIIVAIFGLVVILLAALLLSLQKRRKKTKTSLVESEETLTTKKALLLELLKDLEKQYRAQSISDETYNKLKEEYKQQAVDTMKKLDDLKK